MFSVAKYDLINSRFGRLLVTSLAPSIRGRDRRWSCACDCGNPHEVGTAVLMSGRSRSCGCLGRENLETQRLLRTTHGMRASPMYLRWTNMLTRCQNKVSEDFHNYGGRGITVCSRWQDFANFYKDMGDPPFEGATIERCDNDGDYSPDNCVWGTRTEQSKNRRLTEFLILDGQKVTMREASDRTGIAYQTLWARINVLGWSEARALSTTTQSGVKS